MDNHNFDEGTTHSADSISPNNSILHYQLIDHIGSGGMGEVYLAQDSKLDRLVAIKILSSKPSATHDSRALLFKEARMTAKLSHQNICQIYAIEETETTFFIVMEYIHGHTLKRFFRKTNLEFNVIINIAIQCCEGIRSAHDANIIHRDIKPSNIMIDNRNQVKIMDFGLATSMLDPTGNWAGTLPYMSPEQATNNALDVRSDLFSLGVVFYELTTGERPFHGDNRSMMINSIVNHDPPPVKTLNNEVPDKWAEIIHTLLNKNKENRYNNINELIKELKNNFGIVEPDSSIMQHVNSIAVFPLINHDNDPQLDYISIGVCEEIITKLSKLNNLKVASRSAVMHFKDKSEMYEEICQRLRFKNYLEGTIRLINGRVHINVEVVNVLDKSVLWSDSYDRQLDNIIDLQSEIAEKLAAAFNIKLSGLEEKKLTQRITKSTKAYDNYLKGRFYIKRRDPSSIEKAIKLLEEAVKLDDNFAAAYAELATAYGILNIYGYGDSETLQQKAYQLAEKSVELDPGSSFAHMSLFFVLRNRNFKRTISELKTAIALEPCNYEAHHYLAHIHMWMGHYKSAERDEVTALKLDPFHDISKANLCRIYFYQGDKKKVEAEIKKMELNIISPQLFYSTKGWLLWYSKKWEEAADCYNSVLKIDEKNLVAMNNLADCYRRVCKYDLAINGLKKMLSFENSDYVIHARLGQTYNEIDERETAQHHFKIARESLNKSVAKSLHANSVIFLHDKAWINAREGNIKESIQFLKDSINQGFGNYSDLQCRPDWELLQEDKTFKEMIKELKQNVQEYDIPNS